MWDNDIRNNFDFRFSTSDGESVDVSFKAVSIEHILTKFEDFLRGCGYNLDGQIIVNSTSTLTNSSTLKKNEDILHFGV